MKARAPGQRAHVEPLEDRPFPGIGFAPDHGDGAHALEGKDVKDHQGHRDQRGVNGSAVRVGLTFHGLSQGGCGRLGAFVFADVVDDGHGADEDFARGKRGDDANADFPIEAERRNDGFDQSPQASGETVAQFFAGFLLVERSEFGFDGFAASASRSVELAMDCAFAAYCFSMSALRG